METKARAIIVVQLIVIMVVAAFFTIGYLVTVVFQVPQNLNLSFHVRSLGLFILFSGFLFLAWLFKYRRPADILVSTYVTFSKLGGRFPVDERTRRPEPLVVNGPYRYVRHPLYSIVVLLVLGWWLFLDYTFLLVSAVLLLLWFNFVVTRFEEKELTAIFGKDYEEYMNKVPRIIPFTKRRYHS